MKRREFIALLGCAAVTSPFAAHAQQRVRRIGVLLLGGPEFMGPYRDALRDLGYVEGKNIQLEVRSADGQANRLPAVAAELVRSKVDVIVASLTPAVIAAKNATRDVPIVMAPAGDPVATGLIANLARPGANVTGLSATGAELSSKNLELDPGNRTDGTPRRRSGQLQRSVHQALPRANSERRPINAP
ncbi:MAG: ABC transporter substrate binding protein [Xanthobacteraceae bacterium]